MIITRKRHVPWTWILLAQVPFATWMFAIQLNTSAFTFSLKKFVDNPAVIMFVLTICGFPGLVIGPVLNYLSDRIWTRIGRRKPFIVIPYLLQGLFLCLFPVAPNFYTLVACLWAYQIAGSFGPSIWVLPFEIVPPSQRGLGAAMHQVLFWVAILIFYSVMIGRFDDQYFMGPLSSLFSMSGEQLMYWIAGPMMAVTAFLVALGVKEIMPPTRQTMHDPVTGKWIGPVQFVVQFVKDVFDKQWLVLYTLMFVGSIYGINLGALGALLYTEQWGYTNQEFGMNVAIGAAIMLPFTIGTGWIVDKFDKMKVYQWTLFIPIVINIAYVLFVLFALPDHRPTLWQIILFSEITTVIGNVATVVTYPLLMEYVPRNKMGTVNAGMGVLGGLFTIITANLAGWWVTGYSEAFCPRPGSSVQVVTADVHSAASLRDLLSRSSEFGPDKAAKLNLTPFFYPGHGGKESRQWVIRDFDREAAVLGRKRKQMDDTRSSLQTAIDKAETARKPPPADKVRKVAELKVHLAAADSGLDARAQAFERKVVAALGNNLVAEGEQVRGAKWRNAAIVRVPAARRVGTSEVAALDKQLKAIDPDVIEVLHCQSLVGDGTITAEGPQGVSVALRLPSDSAAVPLQRLSTALDSVTRLSATAAKKKDRETVQDAIDVAGRLVADSAQDIGRRPVLTMDVATLETAHEEQGVALAGQMRNLAIRGTRADSLPKGEGMTVSTVFYNPLKSPDTLPVVPMPVISRLSIPASGLPDSTARQGLAMAVYNDLLKATKDSYLTVARPLISASFAPQKYDYFSGYYLTLIGGIIGLSLTFLVKYFERKGVVKKLGLLEDGLDPNKPAGAQAKKEATL